MDNGTGGAITNCFSYKRFSFYVYSSGSRSGKYIILREELVQASYGLMIFDIQESKLMSLPFKIPGIDLTQKSHFDINCVTQLSDTEVTCVIIVRSHNELRKHERIVMIHLIQTEKTIALSYNYEVPCDHGFFVVGYHARGTNSFLFSLKY